MSQKLITVGLPVYNGESMLKRAMESLLAQDDPHFELVLCDNASTDSSYEIAQKIAEQDSRVRLHRNATNIGAMGNFNKALELAQGELFVFAAHDDFWSPNYLSALRATLEATPEAVLATPLTKHVDDQGEASRHSDDRPATGVSQLANLDRYLEDHACTWIYGLYHTNWLREKFPLIAGDTYASDLIWMTNVILSETVVGTDEAIIYKRIKKSDYTPEQYADQVRAWLTISRRLREIAWEHSESIWHRTRAMQLVTHYCYRKFLRGGNPLSTVKKMCRAGWTAATLPNETKKAA